MSGVHRGDPSIVLVHMQGSFYHLMKNEIGMFNSSLFDDHRLGQGWYVHIMSLIYTGARLSKSAGQR